MKLEVRVKFSSGPSKVVRIREGAYDVFINEKPVQGQANEAMLKALSRHLGVGRTHLRIVRGQTSRNKVIEMAA